MNRSHSTSCERQNSSIYNFFQDNAWIFSACECQELSCTFQESEKATNLDNLFVAAFSVLCGTVKKFKLKSYRHISYLGSLLGKL